MVHPANQKTGRKKKTSAKCSAFVVELKHNHRSSSRNWSQLHTNLHTDEAKSHVALRSSILDVACFTAPRTMYGTHKIPISPGNWIAASPHQVLIFKLLQMMDHTRTSSRSTTIQHVLGSTLADMTPRHYPCNYYPCHSSTTSHLSAFTSCSVPL